LNISLIDIIKVRLLIYGQLHRLPNLKQVLRTIINPFDITRDVEFGYLLKMLKRYNIRHDTILDISSPFIMAYVLSGHSRVTKTDINPAESEMIKEGPNLNFQLEDGTQLSFQDNSFDLVYSISVIEHIHGNYADAVQEMVRVLKPGGYLCLTFPVSAQHTEEWFDHRMYPAQYQKDGKAFFQYRFDRDDVACLLSRLNHVDLVDMSLYWEKKTGGYDRCITWMQDKPLIEKLRSVKNGMLCLWSSFTLLEHRHQGFDHARHFGNASLLFRKRDS
jgi:SAM-dependent methyltransferase